MQTAGKVLQTTGSGAKYPSMAHLFDRPVDVHAALLPAHFAVRNCALTVGVILHDGSDVFLIEPTRAPAGAGVHIFLQEKAKYLLDTTFAALALRGLREELGLTPRDVVLHPSGISWFENHLPKRRSDGAAVTKCIVYLVARIKDSAIIRLNPKEVRQVVYASSCDDYMDAVHVIERSRPHKWVGQTEALMSAVCANQLTGKRWKEFRRMAASGTQNVH